ncbi:MAG: response regulator [Gammaproteobacteria bacterium]|nr:response regulator [Gammaproteobacteria bacterium]
MKPCVLLADDEVFNLEILEELLDDYGFESDTAENGREAVELLTANPGKYQAVLLDRMMPGMGGIEVTHFIKQDVRLRMIPVIMQTAKATKQDIEEGLGAGILYYLTKPFAKEDLLAIVDTAVRYFYECQALCRELGNNRAKMPAEGSIEFRSLNEARNAATRLAGLAMDPDKVVVGLFELFVNAIEHGNLGIGFDYKSELQKSGGWLAEIERRLQLPENRHKKVSVGYQIQHGNVRYTAKDEGHGFNYREFLNISTKRSLNMYGRGIAIAKVLSFDRLDYLDPGNQVVAQTAAA